jgi:hypothetical protein
MFAVLSAVAFLVALVLDLTGTSRGTVSPETFALAGLAFLALWALIPGWPRRP